MNGDLQLRQHVEDELAWEPSVDSASIGVAVKDAIVTLSGECASLQAKRAAEAAVLRIHGVRALASELTVHFPGSAERTDEEIARAAAHALYWNSMVPNDKVTVKVSHGIVTLSGDLSWEYQRDAAVRAVEQLMGVKGVTNLITLHSAMIRSEVKVKIEAALKRSAEVDAEHIMVNLEGSQVTLSGTARTMHESKAAEAAAWKAPGVHSVVNNIRVSAEKFAMA